MKIHLLLTYITNLAIEGKVTTISSFNLLTCWIPCKDLQTMGLESIHHKWWNPLLNIQQWENDVNFIFFPLGKLDISFLVP